MWYRSRTYILREKVTENGTRYFISFKDGQGISYELNVSVSYTHLTLPTILLV